VFDPILDRIRARLEELAALGDTEVRDAGTRLAVALEDGLRVALIDVLTTVADEVSTQLDDAHVEVRMGDPPRVVVVDDETPARDRQAAPDELTARLTLRLPPDLKQRIGDRADEAGISVNAWVVQALDRATDRPRRDSGGRRLRGYARS
jgi:hypothetical protein